MRMIERWFPCAEVSESSKVGWGSGKSERNLFTWFAARPLAQAKAAVLTSVLPWPESEAEQSKLQDLVRRAVKDRDGAWSELVGKLNEAYPNGVSVLDPFSGRGLIPLEAARLGMRSVGLDYSPVATLAGSLLADFPLRDWSGEPELPFGDPGPRSRLHVGGRLVDDVACVLQEVGARYNELMKDVYPLVDGKQPWGYLWAVTLPCQECGRRFPLSGSVVLRQPIAARSDPGQSYRLEVDPAAGTFRAVPQDGITSVQPTLIALKKSGAAVRGKAAICPFCDHVHPKALHTRLAAEGQGRDALLVAADLDDTLGKRFREPIPAEHLAVERSAELLQLEPEFAPGLSAVPDEFIPAGNDDTVRPSAYGAKRYGDLCNARQTLGFVRLCRTISVLGEELTAEHRLVQTTQQRSWVMRVPCW